MRNRVNIADYTALGICLSVVLDEFCAPAQGVAYGFRAQARIQQVGFRNSLVANSADFLFTGIGIAAGGPAGDEIGKAAPLIRAMSKAAAKRYGQRFLIGLGMSYVDLAMVGLNYAPNADPVFFTNGPS